MQFCAEHRATSQSLARYRRWFRWGANLSTRRLENVTATIMNEIAM
jgi:hypothetical protein